MIAGVDGYKKGWIAAIDCGDGSTKVESVGSFRDLLDRKHLTVIVVDVPIGLVAVEARECDLQARKFLGRPRGSSVFPAPIRPMLGARDWDEACRIRFEVERKKCSKQAAGIILKIREVDQSITPQLQDRDEKGSGVFSLSHLG